MHFKRCINNPSIFLIHCKHFFSDSFFVSYIHFIFNVLFFAFSGSLTLSLLGIIGGIWSEKFDHLAGLTNFLITPLTFLSGSFYSIEKLPEILRTIAMYNPFFYFIDGFRKGFIGYSDINILTGIIVCLILNIILSLFVYKMFETGYKLRT